jgi:hypothetical protein
MANANGSSPVLTNVTFSSNEAVYGGGMYNKSGSSPVLTNVTFSRNLAYSDGGGMFNDSSDPVLTKVIFRSNSARGFVGSSCGGGMYNQDSSPVLTNVTFSGNSARHMVSLDSSDGGGMCSSGGSPVLTDVTFRGNSADYGGGMANEGGSSPALTNVTFHGNHAEIIGGGMYNQDSSPVLTNVTFSGNVGDGGGGGMYNWSSSPTLMNTTFNDNSVWVGDGGGISNVFGSSPIIRNSILYGDGGGEIYSHSSTPAVSYSDVQGGYPGVGNIDADPLLGPLANNGGFTQTMALGAGSPAIDAGDDTTCAATDQRGVPRPQRSHCDLGAYEVTPPAITGNVGVARVILSYIDGTPRTVTSRSNGNYSLTVPNNWSGTVTPTHTCFTFTPINRNYSNVSTDQTAQDYIPALKTSFGCADTEVLIGGTHQARYGLTPGASTQQSYAGVNNGPVKIASTNSVSLIGAEQVIYEVNGVNTSFTEMMGLPSSQLDKTYWLPWYNNKDMDTQLRFANVSPSTATVRLYIDGQEKTSGCMPANSPYALEAGASLRVRCAGVNNGPVKIVSTRNIVASQRIIYKVDGVNTSFSEMMALPNKQLSNIYWLPWYNNKDLDTELRFANVSSSPAIVRLYIGGQEKTTGCIPSNSPYTLPAGASLHVSCSGVNKGPVKIKSTQNIVAAERVIYKVDGVPTSFSETMALPNSQVGKIFWMPWYNNVDFDTQLRFANVTSQQATVHVSIGGVEMTGSPFTLAAGVSTRKSFPAVNNGPVKIESNVKIVAAQRVIYKVNGVNTSFSEMMGLPGSQLNTTYWFPWYNHLDLDTQLRFGVP